MGIPSSRQIPTEVRAGSLSLRQLIANRRWWRRSYPFKHVVATDVFRPELYELLETAFRERLGGPGRFERNMPGYDASAFELDSDNAGPFEVFLSREWHDTIAGMMSVVCTNDVVVSLHHHAAGSADGRIHNDLNPGWFVDRPRPDGINVGSAEWCIYKSGKVLKPGLSSRETIRAVAVLFYLNNPPWQRGNGGETGLYSGLHDWVAEPAVAVPPLNNSLVCFECTPFSYHSFISNRFSVRNSLVMWLHRPRSDVVDRWGDDRIVGW